MLVMFLFPFQTCAFCDLIAIFAPQKYVEMKRIPIIFSLLFFLYSCADRPAPGEVAVSLFNALTSGEAQVVRDNIYFADDVERNAFGEYLDMAFRSEDFAERTRDYRADYKVVSEVVNGDSAHVVLVGKTVLKQQTRFTVLLVNVDGCWKVDGRYSVLHRQGE